MIDKILGKSREQVLQKVNKFWREHHLKDRFIIAQSGVYLVEGSRRYKRYKVYITSDNSRV